MIKLIKEFDHVRIKKTGVTGIVVDISNAQGRGGLYIVESDEKGVPGGWWEADPDSWNLFDCTLDELEKIGG
nr:MAG TPA: hypothetical protein [Caudoviricetes sp.]DAV11944.1 MAG TPA: hypothetical protein [Caudoviricetes sp.]